VSGVDPYEDLPPDYRPPRWREYVLAAGVGVVLVAALCLVVLS
jgi:hypothetical protein